MSSTIIISDTQQALLQKWGASVSLARGASSADPAGKEPNNDVALPISRPATSPSTNSYQQLYQDGTRRNAQPLSLHHHFTPLPLHFIHIRLHHDYRYSSCLVLD
ncbi:hypothetical protein NX059_006360 [Plenodomus lindquistii]|nr:hypothetical protein NX059_006360 [Plenodomus lindquistii]